MARNVTVADHLLARLQELGCSDVFGVPGDFNLTLLDHVVPAAGLRWVGCANELNAGYAADGYARLRGIGALMTTFGVGELSAINAVAGSYAEHVPVVHVVGAPSQAAQAGRRVVHHSLGDGDFRHFLRMSAEVTVAQAALVPATAAAEIDRVLVEVRDRRLPGYLLLPVDVVDAPVPPSSTPLPPPADPTDDVALAAFTDAAERLLRGAGRVTVLADLLVHRLRATGELQQLLDAGALPHATLLWGKSLLDESDPRFVGIYTGAASPEDVRRAVEDADVTICAGVQFTDMTSGFFTQHIERVRTVVVEATRASVGGATFAPVSLPAALTALTAVVAAHRTAHPPVTTPAPDGRRPTPVTLPDDDAPLTQEVTWDLVAGLLTPGNVVLADTGTAFYGMATHRLPRGVTFLGQPMWSSIGYALPATLGAALAEPGRRCVLLIGDGAAQLTVQELGTLLRHGLTPVVVVVNNDGYTVERAIHGEDAPYNDIAPWRWTLLPAALGDDTALVARVTTVGELRTALQRAAATPDRLVLIEAVLPRLDVPPLLATLARAAAAANQPAPVGG